MLCWMHFHVLGEYSLTSNALFLFCKCSVNVLSSIWWLKVKSCCSWFLKNCLVTLKPFVATLCIINRISLTHCYIKSVNLSWICWLNFIHKVKRQFVESLKNQATVQIRSLSVVGMVLVDGKAIFRNGLCFCMVFCLTSIHSFSLPLVSFIFWLDRYWQITIIIFLLIWFVRCIVF